MATAATYPMLRMKLLIDTATRRVLFAEAGKDVVDFLFSLLALPLATAVALAGKHPGAGSVGNLYASVEALDDAYVLPGADKGALLRPDAAASPAATISSSFLLPSVPWSPRGGEQSKVFYQCVNSNHGHGYPTGYGGHGGGGTCSLYVTDAYGTPCPGCGGGWMTKALPYEYVSPATTRSAAGISGRPTAGYVQGVVTYTVRDDLTITPMSAISSITLINSFAVADLAALKETTVTLDYGKGVEILRASLQSKTVLTDVFIR